MLCVSTQHGVAHYKRNDMGIGSPSPHVTGLGAACMTEIEALLLSAAIEAPVAYLVAYLARWPSRGNLHIAAASAAATAITHPQLWAAALWSYEHFPYWLTILTLESAVVLTEGVLIAWMAALRIDRALLVSLIANCASMVVGLWFTSGLTSWLAS